MASSHPAITLRASLSQFFSPADYAAAGMAETATPIVGRAFFPGGHGVWAPDGACDALAQATAPDVMLIGNDFDKLDGYLESAKRGFEESAGTWGALEKVLREAGLAPQRCFFTNAIMGARLASGNTGPSPGFSNNGFRDRCGQFLVRQLETVRPSLVLTLGEYAPRVLAGQVRSLGCFTDWRSFMKLDLAGNQLHQAVQTDGPNPVTFTLAALIHPSFRGPNIARRRFGTLTGHAAEIELIRQAMRYAGLSS